MTKRHLSGITLAGISTINPEGLQIAADICQTSLRFDKVRLLTTRDLEVIKHDLRFLRAKYEIKSRSDFSRFIITELYKYIETDYVLMIQPDGFVLNHEAWNDQFLQYDYIGAVWDHIPEGEPRVGNGGFCLISKKFIDLLAPVYARFGGSIEVSDWWMCYENRKRFEDLGITFAPESLARKFSVEGGVWSGEFGFHDFSCTNIDSWIKENRKYEIDVPERTLHKI